MSRSAQEVKKRVPRLHRFAACSSNWAGGVTSRAWPLQRGIKPFIERWHATHICEAFPAPRWRDLGGVYGGVSATIS
jgi:hypothetical protein